MSSDSLASLRSTDQPRELTDSQHSIKVNAYHLHQKMKVDIQDLSRKEQHENTLDALKYAAQILSELRHAHSPKDYYELYSEIFDLMQALQSYLMDYLKRQKTTNAEDQKDLNQTTREEVYDLYSIVQYQTAVLPRLYLMITVGCVYAQLQPEQAKMYLLDMLDMCKGIQHPTRGLFLRYFLQQCTRNLMEAIPLEDSVEFLISNFTEMNKLWVRMQYQGPSKERGKREAERKELRLLVGLNLVRLSSLEGITLDLYKETILRRVLEQVVSCKDVIAQEYLMEALSKVFSDEFHLGTLSELLGALGGFHPGVSIRGIIVAFVDRLVAYSQRPSENGKESTIPIDVNLFEVFWKPVSAVITERQDLSLEDSTALMLCLIQVALSCYKDCPQYVNEVVQFAYKLYSKAPANQLTPYATKRLVLELVKAPLDAYESLLTLLDEDQLSESFGTLVNILPFAIRQAAAILIAKSLIAKAYLTPLTTSEHVNLIYGQFLSCLVKGTSDEDQEVSDEEQDLLARSLHLITSKSGQQTLQTCDDKFVVLSVVKNLLLEGGGRRISRTIPVIIIHCMKLSREYVALDSAATHAEVERKLTTLHKFVHQTVATLGKHHPQLALKQYLLPLTVNLSSDSSRQDGSLVLKSPFVGNEMAAYEFLVSAFSVYEDSVSQTSDQLQMLSLLINSLYQVSNQGILGKDNYDTLSTKVTLYCSRLLRKWDQARFVARCSVLFWGRNAVQFEQLQKTPLNNEVHSLIKQDNSIVSSMDEMMLGGGWSAEPSPSEQPVSGIESLTKVNESNQSGEVEQYRDPKRVLECLQKALKVSDTCMDPLVSSELFVDILNWYVLWFEHGVDSISPKYLNGLVDLVYSNILTAKKDNVVSSASVDNKTSTLGAALLTSTDVLVLTKEQGTAVKMEVKAVGEQPISLVQSYFLRTLKHMKLLKSGNSGAPWNLVVFEQVLTQIEEDSSE